jgi:hypothetical protein
VITEFAEREGSDLDVGDAGDGKSEEPMDMAKERAIAAPTIAAETPGVTILETKEGKENGTRRRRCEALATPRNWWSRMERTIRLQA